MPINVLDGMDKLINLKELIVQASVYTYLLDSLVDYETDTPWYIEKLVSISNIPSLVCIKLVTNYYGFPYDVSEISVPTIDYIASQKLFEHVNHRIIRVVFELHDGMSALCVYLC